MKMPKTPPSLDELTPEILDFVKAALEGQPNSELDFAALQGTVKGAYLHWDDLRHRTPPQNLTHLQWWARLKFCRKSAAKRLPLSDRHGKPFALFLTDQLLGQLHDLSLNAGGKVRIPEPVANAETRNFILVRSLMEEAITSSQLEGAATARAVAKEMIRENRPPRNRSERMILNNYRTMQRIIELKDEPLTKDMVFELHRLVTENTLDDPSAAGRFRGNESIVVEDSYGEILHVPPPAADLKRRLALMCDFANGLSPEGFVHPAIRAIVLHFWLAYDHPFVDGNGRTARALFYWSMLKSGYWLFEYLSISSVILKAPVKYGRAYLLTETDDNDITYFLVYHIEVIRQALEELEAYLGRRSNRLASLEQRLSGMRDLNHRQRDLISHALRHPGHPYSIEPHRVSHGIVYQTARTDLLDLAKRGFLTKQKVANTWVFKPAKDLERRLE